MAGNIFNREVTLSILKNNIFNIKGNIFNSRCNIFNNDNRVQVWYNWAKGNVFNKDLAFDY